MRTYRLGIDGGGSGSRAILVDSQDNLIREESGGSLNPLAAGWEVFSANLTDLLGRLRGSVLKEEIAGLCAGLAGTGSEVVRSRVQSEISGLLPGSRVLIISDAMAALWGAFQGGAGLLLIAGTGSICLGMDGRGRTARAGGFGRLLGDEGSGYWISVEAIRWALKANDAGGTSSQLEAAIREEYRLKDLREVIPLVHESGPERIATLARRILMLSQTDNDARAIIHLAGEHLAALATTTARKLMMAEPNVALWGGLWESSGHELQSSLLEAWKARNFVANIVSPHAPPQWGAIRCLRKEWP